MEKDKFRKCQVTNIRNENMCGMVRTLASSSSPNSQQPRHQQDVESSNLEQELSQQQQQPRQLRVTEDGRSLRVQTDLPHLVSLGGGRLSTTVTLLPLPDGKTMVGTAQATQPQDIVIRGAGVQDQHAYIINHDDVVTLYPLSELTSVDGIRINKPTRLSQGCMVCFGRSSYFRFNHPFEAQRLRSNIRGVVDRYSVSTADTASPSSISTVYDTPKHLKELNGDYDNVVGSNNRFAAVDRYIEQAQQHLAASEAFALATSSESNKRDAGSVDIPESNSQLYDNIEDLHQARIDYRLQQQQGQSSRSRREVNVDSVTSWQQTGNGNAPTDTSSPTTENYSPYEEILPLSRRAGVNSRAQTKNASEDQTQKGFVAKSSDVQPENNLNVTKASLQRASAEYNGNQTSGTLKKGSGRSNNATCSSSAGPSSKTPAMTAAEGKTGDEASSPLTSDAPMQDLPWNGYDNIMQLKEAIIASAAAKLAGSSGVKKPTSNSREVKLPVSSSATKTTTDGDKKLKSSGNQKVASSAKTYSSTSTTTTIQANIVPPAAMDSSECVEEGDSGSRNRRKTTRNSGSRELTTAAHGVITEQHSTPEAENYDEGEDGKINVSATSDRKGRGVSFDRSCRQQTDAGPAAAATHGSSSAVIAIQSAKGRISNDDIGTSIDGDLLVNTDPNAAIRHESAASTCKMQPNEELELDAAKADDNEAKLLLSQAKEKSRSKKSCKEKPPIGKNSSGDKQAKKQTSEPADKKKEQKASGTAEKPEAKKKDSNPKAAQSTAAETTPSGSGKMSFFKSILTRSRSPSPKRGVTNRSPSPSSAASGTNEVSSSSSSLSALKRLSDPLRVSLRQILQGGDGNSAGGKSKSAVVSTEETCAKTKLAEELQQQQQQQQQCVESSCNTISTPAVANQTNLAEHVEVDTDKVHVEQTTNNGYFTVNDIEDSGQSEDASTSSSSAGSVTLSMPVLDDQSEQFQPKIQESNNATSYAAIKVSSKTASCQERRRKLPSTDTVVDGENPWIVNMKELNLASPNLENFKGEKVFQKGTATTNVTLIGFDRASSGVTSRSRNGTGSQQSPQVQDEVSTLSIENRASPARSAKATSNTDVRSAGVSTFASNDAARNSSPIYDTVYVDRESMAGTPKLAGDSQVSTLQTNKVATDSLTNVQQKSLRTDKDDAAKTAAGKWEADRQALEKSGPLLNSGGSASKKAVSTTETTSAKTNHESTIVSSVRPENQLLTSASAAAAAAVPVSRTRPTPPRTLTSTDGKRVDGVLATSSDRDQTVLEKLPRAGAEYRTSRDGGNDEAGYNRLVEHHQTILKCSSLPSYTKSQRFDPAAIFAAFDKESSSQSAAEAAIEKVDCKRDTLAALSFIDPDELSASQRDLVNLFRQQKAERQQEEEQAQREKKRWEKIETMWKEFEAQSTTSPISGGLGVKDKLSPPVKADTIDLLHRTGRHLSGGGLHMATGYRSAVSQDNIYGSETLSRRTIRQPMSAHDRSLDELMDEFNATLAQQFQGSSSKRKVSASGPDRAPSHCAVASETFSRLSSKQYNGNDIGGGGLAGVRQTPGYTAGVVADGTSGVRPRASSCSQRPSANIPARPRAAVTATSPATAAPLLGNIGCGPGERSRSQNPLEQRNDYRHVTRGGIGGMTSRSTFDLGVDYRQDNGHNGFSGDITSSSSDLDGDSNVSSSMCRLDVGCHSSADSQKCLSENNRDFLIEEQLKLIQKQLRRKQLAIEALELERQRCLQLERRLHREMNSATRFSEESTGDSTAAAAAAAASGGDDVINDDLETAIRMREKRRGSAVTPASTDEEKLDDFRAQETRISSPDLVTAPGRTAVPSRPLTRYLPMRSKQFDLRHFVESSGHNLAHSGQHVEVTATACRGFLWKMAGGAFRKWNKRWFVFDRTRRSLVYYVDKIETSKAARGTIYFQSINDVFVDHLQTIRSPNPRLTFCIKTAERLLYLMAPTDETMRIWIDVVFTGAEGYQQFT